MITFRDFINMKHPKQITDVVKMLTFRLEMKTGLMLHIFMSLNASERIHILTYTSLVYFLHKMSTVCKYRLREIFLNYKNIGVIRNYRCCESRLVISSGENDNTSLLLTCHNTVWCFDVLACVRGAYLLYSLFKSLKQKMR